jgi:hypothetical protein
MKIFITGYHQRKFKGIEIEEGHPLKQGLKQDQEQIEGQYTMPLKRDIH